MGQLARTKAWLLTLYLGTAPIQWLPGIEYEWVVRAKVALFVLAVGSVFLGTRLTQLRVPGGLAGPLGFASLVGVSVPALAQSDLGPSLGYLADVIYGATMLWCLYNVARLDTVATRRILGRSAVMVAVFATVALAFGLVGVDWQSPCRVGPFRDTAFGCSRTGWSGGLALYVPILAVFAFRRDVGIVKRWAYAALTVGVVAGQAGSGGRAGVVSSVVVIAVFVYYYMPRRWKIMACPVALLAAVVVTVPDGLYERLRLDEIPENPKSLMDLDYVSSGRVAGALDGIGYITKRPFAGHGIESVTVEFRGGQKEIHNLWLKWAAYCGVLAPLLFLALVLSVLLRARNLVGMDIANRSVAAACGLVIVAGLVQSMLEPGTPFGEFQNNALWWVAAGVLLGMSITRADSAGTNRPAGG